MRRIELGEITFSAIVWILIAALFIWLTLNGLISCSQSVMLRTPRGHYVSSALISYTATLAEVYEIATGEYIKPCAVSSNLFKLDCCYSVECKHAVDSNGFAKHLQSLDLHYDIVDKPTLKQIMQGLSVGVWAHVAQSGNTRLVYGAHSFEKTIFFVDPVSIFERYRDHRDDWRYMHSANRSTVKLANFPAGDWFLIYDKVRFQ